jgi:hypothetical protein
MYLDVKSIISLCLVNKEIESVCNSWGLWAFLLNRDYCEEDSHPKDKYSEYFIDDSTHIFIDGLLEAGNRLVRRDVRYIFNHVEDEICIPIRQYSRKLCSGVEYTQQIRRIVSLTTKTNNFCSEYQNTFSPKSKFALKADIICEKIRGTVEKCMISILSSLCQNFFPKLAFKKIIGYLSKFGDRFDKIIENALISSELDLPALWRIFIRDQSFPIDKLITIWYKLHKKRYNESAKIILNYIQTESRGMSFRIILEDSSEKTRKYAMKLLSMHGNDIFL